MIVKVNDLLNVYYKEVSITTKNKRKIYNFEKHKMVHIANILTNLKENNYKISNYNIFYIYEPKLRIIMSLDIENRVIDHYISKYILLPKINKYLDIRNVASRKNMGMSYGIKLLKKYIEKNKKYPNIYILKLDISKFFYRIDHEILKNMLKDKLTKEELELINIFIDSTNRKYVNETIKKIKEKLKKETSNNSRLKEIEKIPYYEYGKGLPIGNVCSQILSIFYLSEVDHYIVHTLKCKYMLRYCDDIIILHHDKEYLKEIYPMIVNKIKEYKLEINEKKSFITNLKDGVIFCGKYIKLSHNKTIIKISNKSKTKIKRNIKRVTKQFENNKITYRKYFTSINSYTEKGRNMLNKVKNCDTIK